MGGGGTKLLPGGQSSGRNCPRTPSSLPIPHQFCSLVSGDKCSMIRRAKGWTTVLPRNTVYFQKHTRRFTNKAQYERECLANCLNSDQCVGMYVRRWSKIMKGPPMARCDIIYRMKFKAKACNNGKNIFCSKRRFLIQVT